MQILGISFSEYVKIFGHNTLGGLFSNKDDVLKKNFGNSSADLYSKLYELENYRNSESNFQFNLCYPLIKGIGGRSCNEWIQSSNPVTNSTITGFKPLSLAFTKDSYNKDWKGLGINLPELQKDTLIDDSPSQSYWFTAIGAFKYWGGKNTIPGPRAIKITKVELFVLFKKITISKYRNL